MEKGKKDCGNKEKKPLSDLALWQEVQKTIDPLAMAHREKFVFGPGLTKSSGAEKSFDKSPPSQGKISARKLQKRRMPLRPRPSDAVAPALKNALEQGDLKAMDRRQAERFKKGKMAMEAVLDLHGMTQAQARKALNHYVEECYSRGLRCVLLITGRGSAPGSEGILKSMAPHWLNQTPNRNRIVAFTAARHHHGGTGALYLLIKRRRDS